MLLGNPSGSFHPLLKLHVTRVESEIYCFYIWYPDRLSASRAEMKLGNRAAVMGRTLFSGTHLLQGKPFNRFIRI